MASRLGTSSLTALASEFGTALQAFKSSGAKFRVLKTVHPSDRKPREPSRLDQDESPKTLFILDSSFNPPSIAHRTLAQSALLKTASDGLPKPHRLLLLFATMNADKAPSAASFDQRLALMSVFARDLIQSMLEQPDVYSIVPVDIGVTTVPYYTDKSRAIETEGLQWYPLKCKHTHLVGFDTITRFFAAKYYPKFDPPFSALNPYFDAGHSLRVTLRPDDEYGSIEEQKAFVHRLEDGEMEAQGGKRAWSEQIELVSPTPEAGVSSTKVRKAAKAGDWEQVRDLCTPTVAQYVQESALYNSEVVDAKMA